MPHEWVQNIRYSSPSRLFQGILEAQLECQLDQSMQGVRVHKGCITVVLDIAYTASVFSKAMMEENDCDTYWNSQKQN